MAFRDILNFGKKRVVPPEDQGSNKEGTTIERSFGGASGIFGFSGTGLATGGATNLQTGMGTSIDKGQNTEFINRALQSESYFNYQLEALWLGSYICGKAVDLPIEDMLSRWRDYESDNEQMVKDYQKAEKEFKVRPVLSQALRAAKLFGTGMVVIVSKEAPLDTPLDPTMIKPGDLVGFRPYTRYDMTIKERGSLMMESDMEGMPTSTPKMNRDGNPIYTNNFFDKNYDKPAIYELNLTEGSNMMIHESRVIRFDGIKPLSDKGFSSFRGSPYGNNVFNRDWGVSEVIRMIQAIMMDETIFTSISHVAQEWTIPIFKSPQVSHALATDDPNATKLGEIIEKVRRTMSVHRMMVSDSEGGIERLNVQWSGLPEVIDRIFKVVAAVTDMPATRFYGQSPVGMNATGDSDLVNYLMSLESERTEKLDDPVEKMDMVLSAHLGMTEPLPFKWTSLIDFSEAEQLQNSKTKMETFEKALDKNVVDENEVRDRLTGDVLFGELPPIDLEELEEKRLMAAQAEMVNRQPPVQQDKDEEDE